VVTLRRGRLLQRLVGPRADWLACRRFLLGVRPGAEGHVETHFGEAPNAVSDLCFSRDVVVHADANATVCGSSAQLYPSLHLSTKNERALLIFDPMRPAATPGFVEKQHDAFDVNISMGGEEFNMRAVAIRLEVAKPTSRSLTAPPTEWVFESGVQYVNLIVMARQGVDPGDVCRIIDEAVPIHRGTDNHAPLRFGLRQPSFAILPKPVVMRSAAPLIGAGRNLGWREKGNLIAVGTTTELAHKFAIPAWGSKAYLLLKVFKNRRRRGQRKLGRDEVHISEHFVRPTYRR
jgi:hypothetical protein